MTEAELEARADAALATGDRDEIKATARLLREHGWSLRLIGYRLFVHWTTVRRWTDPEVARRHNARTLERFHERKLEHA